MSNLIIDLFKTFPKRTYEPVEINDVPLKIHLQQSVFHYTKKKKTVDKYDDHRLDEIKAIPKISNVDNKYFTLLVNTVNSNEKGIWAIDPQCFFLQLLIARTNNLHYFLTSKVNGNSINENADQSFNDNTLFFSGGKILSVDRMDLPMLLDDQSQLHDTRSLLLNVENKYMSTLERQYCKMIDTYIYKAWKWEISHLPYDSDRFSNLQYDVDLSLKHYGIISQRAQSFLTLLEKNARVLFSKKNYFTLKLTSIVWCITQGPPLPLRTFINKNCQDLSQMTNNFLFD